LAAVVARIEDNHKSLTTSLKVRDQDSAPLVIFPVT
jgi:hypothetical protein